MAIKLEKNAFVKNLIKRHKLAPFIDKAIGEGEFNWSAQFGAKVGDDGWHPSGDCTPSPFALYHRALDATDPLAVKPAISASLLKTFQVGHFWHAYIQHIVVERLGFSNWDEIECRGTKGWGEETSKRYFGIESTHSSTHSTIFKPFHYATGSADIAPCRIPVHGDYLVDIKTMGAHDFKQSGLPSWCAPKYECQINIYMDWFDLERAIILCVSKDSPHDLKEFEFVRNQPLIDAIYDKWKLVSDCLDASVEPDEDCELFLPLAGPKL